MKMTKQMYKEMGFTLYENYAYYGNTIGGFSLELKKTYSLKYCIDKIKECHEKLGKNTFKKEIQKLFDN
jgi:RNA binding exosome subunit